MKNHSLKIVFVLSLLPVFAQADIVANPEVYNATESLSKYVQQKDDSYNAGVLQRKALENAEEEGDVKGNLQKVMKMRSFYSSKGIVI